MRLSNIVFARLRAPTRILWAAIALLVAPAAARAQAAFVLPFQQLQARPFVDEEGFVGTRIEWSGAGLERRSLHLIDNTVVDPTGHWGGYARTLTYPVGHKARVCRGTNEDYPGFGMVVNHFEGGSSNSVRRQGTSATLLFAGAHHALYEYRWRYAIADVPVDIVVHWLFATGNPSPLYAITYDLSRAEPGALTADTRAPYGEIDWDGGRHADVDGVAWGDEKIFRTLEDGEPVSFASGFTYAQDNVVPFTQAYSLAADAEMGLVQTQTQAQHAAGGYDGYKLWGERRFDGPMPEASNWAYQLQQWQLPGDPAAKRHAWGSNFGAVGQRCYQTMGDKRQQSGWPYHSYSVYVVNDTHTRDEVAHRTRAVTWQQRGTLQAEGGSAVRAGGPGGVGRSDWQAYDVRGLNPVYDTWELDRTASAEALSFSLTAHVDAPIERPTFVIHGVARLPASFAVEVNGVLQRSQMGYFVSEDPAHEQIWLTLNKTVDQRVRVTLRGL